MKNNKLILLTTLAVLSLGTFTTVSNATANAQTIKFTLVKTKKDTKKTTKKAKLTKFDKQELKWRKQLAKGDVNSTTNNQTQTTNIVNGYDENTNDVTNYNDYYQTYIKTALNAINAYRMTHGVSPLTLDTQLTNVANQRAQQGYEYLNQQWYDGHHDKDGNFIAQQLENQMGIPYNIFGENSASGCISGILSSLDVDAPTTAAKNMINDWISEGVGGHHYDNLMNPNFHKIGIGVYVGPSKGQDTAGGYAEEYTD